DAGRAGARPVHRRLIGVAVAPMQRVKVARLVRGMDRHPLKPRLLQIDDARALELIDQRRSHESSLGVGQSKSQSANYKPQTNSKLKSPIPQPPRFGYWPFDIGICLSFAFCVLGFHSRKDRPKGNPSWQKKPEKLSLSCEFTELS